MMANHMLSVVCSVEAIACNEHATDIGMALSIRESDGQQCFECAM